MSHQCLQRHDLYFLRMAKVVSHRSKDPSTKVGAVIVAPTGEVVSTGFNGFGRGVLDLPEHYADRKIKLSKTIHAEMNAMIFARRDLTGATIYIWPLMCCGPCAKHLVQAGIARFVAPYSDEPRWQESFEEAREHIADGKRELLEVHASMLPPDLRER